MAPLSEPSPEFAAKVLRRVGSKHRLAGVKMSPMAGNLEQPMYSLEGAIKFLEMDSGEHLIGGGPQGSIPYVDPKFLGRWVADVLGDDKLAEAIDEAVERSKNHRERIKAARALMEQRVSQCKAVLECTEDE